jgi:hypothetical protein
MIHVTIGNVAENVGVLMDGNGDEVPAWTGIIPSFAPQGVLSCVGFWIVKHPPSYSTRDLPSK